MKIKTSGRTTGRIGSDSFSERVSSVVDMTWDVLEEVVLGVVCVDVGLTWVVRVYREGVKGVVLAGVGWVIRVDGGLVGLVGGEWVTRWVEAVDWVGTRDVLGRVTIVVLGFV